MSTRYELMFSIMTPTLVYSLSIAPLSWRLGLGGSRGGVTGQVMQIGPIKIIVFKAVWNPTDA